ncbi:hypothetical protein F2Q69_00024150 [Brassica cretica]|uniref:Uncharacterized protein n=1 Tax=Brassica cretica TaxID=69181 RepID=A0A8S9QPE7_BRACR|nr:hypothetical protein F2Q69_00024150 [Brassica cretica]
MTYVGKERTSCLRSIEFGFRDGRDWFLASSEDGGLEDRFQREERSVDYKCGIDGKIVRLWNKFSNFGGYFARELLSLSRDHRGFCSSAMANDGGDG